MSNQPISGYRDLTDDEIDTINQIKEKAAEVGVLCDKIESGMHGANINVDPRWLAIGRTDLQKGFMSLTRAIARPGGF